MLIHWLTCVRDAAYSLSLPLSLRQPVDAEWS
jgi:hypothetical protein